MSACRLVDCRAGLPSLSLSLYLSISLASSRNRSLSRVLSLSAGSRLLFLWIENGLAMPKSVFLPIYVPRFLIVYLFSHF